MSVTVAKPYAVSLETGKTGVTVLLEGKPALTPLKRPLMLPSRELAQAVAAEWQLQNSKLKKDTMPLTQFSCVAIDLVGEKRSGVMEEIVAYGQTDLVCYRAGNIPELHKRQDEALAPVLAWAQKTFAVTFNITGGLMPVAQPAQNEACFRRAVAAYDDWRLAALAVAVKPLGSLVLGLALMEGQLTAQEAFTLSQLEETYETEQWGKDEEKEQKIQNIKTEIEAVGAYLALLPAQSVSRPLFN